MGCNFGVGHELTVLPFALQEAVPKGLENVLPESIHPTK